MKTDLDYICEAALYVAGRYSKTRNEWDHFAGKLLRVIEEKKGQEEYLKKQAEETKKKECEDHPFGIKIDGSRSCGGSECEHDFKDITVDSSKIRCLECTKCGKLKYVECEHDIERRIGCDPASKTDPACVIIFNYCKKCTRLWILDQKLYYSGKDALDKLMSGECDYIVLDDENWKSMYNKCYVLDGWISSKDIYCPKAIMHKSYYLQTKWLCLKDDK